MVDRASKLNDSDSDDYGGIQYLIVSPTILKEPSTPNPARVRFCDFSYFKGKIQALFAWIQNDQCKIRN